VLLDARAQSIPIHADGTVHFDKAAARLAQQLQGVLRQNTLVPQAAAIAGVAAALLGQFRGCPIGVIANGFHGAVGKLDCSFRGIRHAHFMQAILKAHDPMPTGRCLRLALRALSTA